MIDERWLRGANEDQALLDPAISSSLSRTYRREVSCYANYMTFHTGNNLSASNAPSTGIAMTLAMV